MEHGESQRHVAIPVDDFPRPGEHVGHALTGGLGSGPEFEVLDAVVISDPVLVVYRLARQQATTNMLLHDVDVLAQPSFFGLDLDVAVAHFPPVPDRSRRDRFGGALRAVPGPIVDQRVTSRAFAVGQLLASPVTALAAASRVVTRLELLIAIDAVAQLGRSKRVATGADRPAYLVDNFAGAAFPALAFSLLGCLRLGWKDATLLVNGGERTVGVEGDFLIASGADARRPFGAPDVPVARSRSLFRCLLASTASRGSGPVQGYAAAGAETWGTRVDLLLSKSPSHLTIIQGQEV